MTISKTRVEIDFVRIIAILLTVIILNGCTAGSPTIVKMPTPQDMPAKPPELPGFVPVYPHSTDKEGDALRVVYEPFQNDEGIVYIRGTRISTSSGGTIYDWYRMAFDEYDWETTYEVPYDSTFESAALTGLKDNIMLSIRIMFEQGSGNIEISYYAIKNSNKEGEGK